MRPEALNLHRHHNHLVGGGKQRPGLHPGVSDSPGLGGDCEFAFSSKFPDAAGLGTTLQELLLWPFRLSVKRKQLW